MFNLDLDTDYRSPQCHIVIAVRDLVSVIYSMYFGTDLRTPVALLQASGIIALDFCSLTTLLMPFPFPSESIYRPPH